jgi:SAM-dependent methyltransferase
MRTEDEMSPFAMSVREVSEQWDRNADLWAEQVRAGFDRYRELYNNPAFFAFAGELGGLAVLDAGCGEGYNTRLFARRGARMTGVDASARMIELARAEERRAPLGIRYQLASFSNLNGFADGAFDAVVSTMALMDGPDFAAAARELRRVLRPGGALVFSILHPCFATKGLRWIRDDRGRAVRLTVGGYFDDAPWVEGWRFKSASAVDAPKFFVPRFDRTLSQYLNALIDARLVIERVEEPRPSEEACAGNEWLRRWRDVAPLFLYVRARRPE